MERPLRILVTGGTGFIGSNLCKSLINDGHTVVCMDNNSTGRMKNIEELQNHPNFSFLKCDIVTSSSKLRDLLCDMLEIDQIYHLACPASPPAYQADPIKTIQTCTIGTMNILDFALKQKARILLTSTSEVYGDPTETPQSEEYRGNVNTLGIRACYDEGKRISETLFMEYHRVHGLDTRIARIFNTYGENMSPNDGRVVSNFIMQSLHGEDITIYGDGSQTRSFCYVEDTVRGLRALMDVHNLHTPVNIGNPNEITVKDLAEKIVNLVPKVLEENNDISRSKIIYKNLPEDDPKQRCPDIKKARAFLNWSPEIDLETGLKNTIHYFCEYKYI